MSNGKNICLILRHADSPDVENSTQLFDFTGEIGYEAPNPYDVIFLLNICVGEEGQKGCDDFSVMVITENNIQKIPTDVKRVVIHPYSFKSLKNRLNDMIKSCEDTSWEISVNKLRSKFDWEYEGYTEFNPILH
jgi:hypothetical protein